MVYATNPGLDRHTIQTLVKKEPCHPERHKSHVILSEVEGESKACPERRSRGDRSRMGTCGCSCLCFSRDRRRTNRPVFLFPVPYSLFPIPCFYAALHRTRVRNRLSPHPSHAQRSPQADFAGLIAFNSNKHQPIQSDVPEGMSTQHSSEPVLPFNFRNNCLNAGHSVGGQQCEAMFPCRRDNPRIVDIDTEGHQMNIS
jgi:hypothetical protein